MFQNNSDWSMLKRMRLEEVVRDKDVYWIVWTQNRKFCYCTICYYWKKIARSKLLTYVIAVLTKLWSLYSYFCSNDEMCVDRKRLRNDIKHKNITVYQYNNNWNVFDISSRDYSDAFVNEVYGVDQNLVMLFQRYTFLIGLDIETFLGLETSTIVNVPYAAGND